MVFSLVLEYKTAEGRFFALRAIGVSLHVPLWEGEKSGLRPT